MTTDRETMFLANLLQWYSIENRDLPWRRHPEPYRIWVSEIMLQQTRVETVIPYFNAWIEEFPTVSDLASASQTAVLSAWEGLGYYSRARNLHKAAQIIVADFDGDLPSDPDELRKLPGIGRYTAGAIASIAFGQDEPVVDGNIRRVLARVFNVDEVLGSAAAEKVFWDLASTFLPAGQAGDYNQAMMDLGAMICLPKSPHCNVCPVGTTCMAQALGLQEVRPVRKARADIPHYTVAAAVIEDGERVLITRRPQNALLGGMWEFPGGKIQPGEGPDEALQREIAEELGVLVRVGEPCGVYNHAYTHYRVTVHTFRCRVLEGTPEPLEADELMWALYQDLPDFPMGKIDRMISSTIQDNPKDR